MIVSIVWALLSILYCIMGVGVITLIRYRDPGMPKLCGVVWPIMLAVCAFGELDKNEK